MALTLEPKMTSEISSTSLVGGRGEGGAQWEEEGEGTAGNWFQMASIKSV